VSSTEGQLLKIRVVPLHVSTVKLRPKVIALVQVSAVMDADFDRYCFFILDFDLGLSFDEGRDLNEMPSGRDAFLIDVAGRPVSRAAVSR
jgi:hypothetical protein